MVELSLNGEEGSYPSASVQVMLPKFVSKKIVVWGEDNIPDGELYAENDPCYGREYESHITVLHNLKQFSSKELRRLTHRHRCFDIELGQVTIFNTELFDVVKIEIESPELRRLHKDLSEHFQSDQNHSYRPHITIAFLQKGFGLKYNKCGDFVSNRIHIDRVFLSSKIGQISSIRLKKQKQLIAVG